MEDKLTSIEPLIARLEEYGKTSFELVKLRALSKTAAVVSVFASRATVVLALSLFIVTINIGAALWLGDLLGKSYYGFFCVAGFYCIAVLILYFFLHDPIKRRINRLVILHLFNE
jgi:hypothetical protein